MFVFLVCLVLAALSVDAGGYAQSGLYNNYHGDYAGAYDNYEPRSYAFEYGVSDPHTGDHKTQWETKGKDGVVRGSYSLLESDGSTRIVDYVADDHGFRAVVKKIGVHGHPESIESHGGAVEETQGFTPIVVAEPESVHLQQPLPVEHELQNTLHLEQPVHVQQPIHYEPPVHVPQGPVFQSYDGGVEDYQNLYNQQPYHFQVPKAEGIYVDLPKHNFGYVEQPYAAPKEIYLEQPYAPQPHIESNQGVYLQQPYPAHKEEGYGQQPYPAHKEEGYGQQPQFLPNQEFYEPQSYGASKEQFHLNQGLLPPRAEGYYTQHNQYAQPKGDGAVDYHQPEQYIPQEQVEQPHQVPIEGKLAETYQSHQQYPASKENNIEPYQVKLPVENYHLEQYFPGENQVLLETPGQYGGHVLHPHGESSQGYYGSTGNLHGDSEYTNYGNSGAGELALNQGEYVPQASHYKTPLPLNYLQGHQVVHK